MGRASRGQAADDTPEEGAGALGTGAIGNGKIWHNKSVPNFATAFQNLCQIFLVPFLALSVCTAPSCPSIQKPPGNNSKHPEANRRGAVYACSCATAWEFCTKFCCSM